MPRRRATIATLEGKLLGWVNRYGDKRFSEAYRVGIDICQDAYLDQGVGTEALGLWVDYLFSNSDVHRIGLDTWSFNGRMMRVAEKLGFVREGAERELIRWQGEWLDLVHFGMLRREWENLWGRSKGESYVLSHRSSHCQSQHVAVHGTDAALVVRPPLVRFGYVDHGL